MSEGTEPPLIVLVRPQLGENIGKAARAMLNFGLTEMRLVAPRDGWPNPDAGPAASGADEVLAQARVFDSVAEAVADCAHVYATTVRKRGVTFMDTPDTYYENVNKRVKGHKEDVKKLGDLRILIDGAPTEGILLQIFTSTVIGPIFFEIIQRKGNEGFGEGNFKALFESIEEDQIRRGVLNKETA